MFNQKENLMTKKQINKALLEGCKKGDYNKVRFALNFGADVEAKDNYGWTPLHLASRNNHIEIAKPSQDQQIHHLFRQINCIHPMKYPCIGC